MERPVLLQACLNGARFAMEHELLPITAEELARDAVAVRDRGATALHVHPRDADGAETLEASVVDAAVRTIRAAAPELPIGVSTGAWIPPGLRGRVEAIGGWSEPDYASVNLDEDSHRDVMEALLARGIGIEAGVSTPAEVEALLATGLADRVLRVLIEVDGRDPDAVVADAWAIDAALEAAGVAAPRLHHGFGDTTWAVLRAAKRGGRDIGVGLEDTLRGPSGGGFNGNVELVGAAVAL